MIWNFYKPWKFENIYKIDLKSLIIFDDPTFKEMPQCKMTKSDKKPKNGPILARWCMLMEFVLDFCAFNWKGKKKSGKRDVKIREMWGKHVKGWRG